MARVTIELDFDDADPSDMGVRLAASQALKALSTVIKAEPGRMVGRMSRVPPSVGIELSREEGDLLQDCGAWRIKIETPQRVRHIGRDTVYAHITGTGKVQSKTPLKDNAAVAVYQDRDGQVYVRPVQEYYDPKRFEVL